MYRDIKNRECLIYSFGIADDWTFEEYMASLGCTVRFLHSLVWYFSKSVLYCRHLRQKFTSVIFNKTTSYRYMLLTLLLMKHQLKVRHQTILVFRNQPYIEKQPMTQTMEEILFRLVYLSCIYQKGIDMVMSFVLLSNYIRVCKIIYS